MFFFFENIVKKLSPPRKTVSKRRAVACQQGYVFRCKGKLKQTYFYLFLSVRVWALYSPFLFQFSQLFSCFLHIFLLRKLLIANEQAERRRLASEAASLMPREVLQQAEKFSIVLLKV